MQLTNYYKPDGPPIPDHYWSDDDARLAFGKHESPPTEVKAVVGGYSGVVEPHERTIPLANLTLIAAYSFYPESRGCDRVVSNKKYAAYEWAWVGNTKALVLVSNTGMGLQFMVLRDILKPFKALKCSTNGIWRLIQSFFATYERGEEAGEQRMRQVFVEGRLKKRKNRGQDNYKVWIDPKQIS